MAKQFFHLFLIVSLLTACEEPPQWKETESIAAPVGSLPTIATIGNQTTLEDTTINNIAVTINDADSSLSCSGMSFVSGNPSLVRNQNISATGTAPNCLIRIVPEANQTGFAPITVLVRDPQNNVTSAQFQLQVTSVNDAPAIAVISDKSTLKSTSSLPFQVVTSDIDSSLNCSLLTATSSNQSIVSNSGLVFSGQIPNCQLVVTPVANQTGIVQLNVQISDGSLTVQRIFNFEVLEFNLPPTISNISNQLQLEDFASFQIPFLIDDPETNLNCVTSLNLLSSEPEVLSITELQISGTAPNCLLTVNSKTNGFGETDISLIVSDGSKTATEVFKIQITAVNDAPTISPFSDRTISWNTSYLLEYTLEDIDDNVTCDSPSVVLTSSNPGLVSVSEVTLSGSAPSCSALITPTPGGWGNVLLSFEATDGELSTISNIQLRVQSDILLTPSASLVSAGSFINFSTTGGSGSGYIYSIVSGGGSIDSGTGILTTPAAAGFITVRVTDSLGDFDLETIEVYEALSITPTSLVLGVNLQRQFVTTGGYGEISFTVTMGNGIISSAGLYTATGITGAVEVTATDELGGNAVATITVVSALSISPTSLDLPVSSTAQFSGGGGQTSFSFSLFSGSGTVNSTTGVLTAPATQGSAVVAINDQSSQSAQANVNYIRPVKLSAGTSFTCALYSNGKVKCWGIAASGQLGQGNTTILGDNAAEVGGALNFINLGTGRTVLDISSGASHSCALLDNYSVKCWGLNSSGQLGIGSTQNKGDNTGEMGDSLPAVDLGVGRTAKVVVAGSANTCAILDNDSLKCWGVGTSGINGKGNITTLGDNAAEMGDNLTPINFGTGKTVKQVSLAKITNSACAILNDNTVKCWGINTSGRLGYGDVAVRGDGANEMGDFLPVVNLGTGRTALDISLGRIHTCARLDNNSVKCWGEAGTGQIGSGGTLDLGDGAGEMGDSLAAVSLGTGFTPAQISTAQNSTCVLSTLGSMKCFGAGASGVRLSGNTTNNGTSATQLGNNLAISSIGSEQITHLAMGTNHGCAILSNDRIKCWGAATGGALLNGSTTLHLGDGATETGNNLPFLNH